MIGRERRLSTAMVCMLGSLTDAGEYKPSNIAWSPHASERPHTTPRGMYASTIARLGIARRGTGISRPPRDSNQIMARRFNGSIGRSTS